MATRKKSSDNDGAFEEAVSTAARSLGWLLPQTEEEVEESEQALDDEMSTPATLRDPFEALDREAPFSRRPDRAAETQPEYEAELRRAARSGKGPVTEEVEAKMRRDRKEAEQEKDRE